jgi:hypothetical protein
MLVILAVGDVIDRAWVLPMPVTESGEAGLSGRFGRDL